MPFTGPGSDIAMARNPATGKLDFDWDATGNPRFSDDNIHRVLSLLIEHRPLPSAAGIVGSPGYWDDATGKRGSLLYTIRNIRRTTNSDVEAMGRDALQKAIDEGWISAPDVKSFLTTKGRARVEVHWKNPGSRPASTTVALAS